MNTYRYSPLNIADYRITALPECEVSHIMKLDDLDALAVWNLYWLSMPYVDGLPGIGPRWGMVYMSMPGATRAITADALSDEVLYRKLLMHPTRFMDWFEREDASIFDCYTSLGGPSWRQSVLIRAAEAEARIADEEAPEVYSFSNVFDIMRKRVA